MRKIVSLLIAILVLSSVCIPALAAENDLPALNSNEKWWEWFDSLTPEQQACINFRPDTNASMADGTEEYIRFSSGKSRIDSNGDFTFYIKSDLTSGKFTAKDDSLTIKASAYIYNNKTGGDRKSSNVKFTISLYKYNEDSSDTFIDSFTGSANKKSSSKSFSVESNQKYYMIITIQGTLGNTEYVKGSGNISNI